MFVRCMLSINECFLSSLLLYMFLKLFVINVFFFYYHRCCVFRSTEESSPGVKPKFKTDTKFKDSERKSRLTEAAAAPDSKRKFSGPKMKFPKSKDKVNVWSKQKKAEVKKKEQAPCWLVVFVFCCGVSKEHQWYSLLGKGRMHTMFYVLIPIFILSFCCAEYFLSCVCLAWPPLTPTAITEVACLSFTEWKRNKVGHWPNYIQHRWVFWTSSISSISPLNGSNTISIRDILQKHPLWCHCNSPVAGT